MCMLCSVCGRCTGYGVDCVNQGQADRNPGTACGCGAGDSGCSECGVCRTCAAEAPDMDGDDIDRQILEKSKELLSIDLMLGTCICTKKVLETCFILVQWCMHGFLFLWPEISCTVICRM